MLFMHSDCSTSSVHIVSLTVSRCPCLLVIIGHHFTPKEPVIALLCQSFIHPRRRESVLRSQDSEGVTVLC